MPRRAKSSSTPASTPSAATGASCRGPARRTGRAPHIDTKKLGRIERIGHRITGNRRDTVDGAGWEFLFVAIDDRARIGFTDLYPDERKASAVQFLRNTVAYFASLGVRVKRVLTDNGSAFRSKAFAKACRRLGLKHSFTRPYRPQTKALTSYCTLFGWLSGDKPGGRASVATSGASDELDIARGLIQATMVVAVQVPLEHAQAAQLVNRRRARRPVAARPLRR